MQFDSQQVFYPAVYVKKIDQLNAVDDYGSLDYPTIIDYTYKFGGNLYDVLNMTVSLLTFITFVRIHSDLMVLVVTIIATT